MKRTFLLVLALCAWLVAVAQGVLPVPELTARVIDQTGTLDAIQQKGLEDKLAAFEQKKGSQMVVLMVPTTQPEDIASYANRVANSWKIGRRDVGDGILVIIAKNDRRVRIEVAKTLEGAVPDLAASMIIEQAITPRFRQDDFAGGLHAGVDQLVARVTGEALPAPAQPRAPPRGAGGFDLFTLAIPLLIALPIVSMFARGLFGRKFGGLLMAGGAGVVVLLITSSIVAAVLAGVIALFITLLGGGSGPLGSQRARGYRRSGYGAPVILPGGWGGGSYGGGGGWGGGGGFSSGGGGDFGGGGASGDW